MEYKYKDIGLRIKNLRKSTGMTQKSLAKFVEVDVNHISQIERGNRYPSLKLLLACAEVLNIPISDFFVITQNEADAKIDNITRILRENPSKIDDFEKILLALL